MTSTWKVDCKTCSKKLAFGSVIRHMKTVHEEKNRKNMVVQRMWQNLPNREETSNPRKCPQGESYQQPTVPL